MAACLVAGFIAGCGEGRRGRSTAQPRESAGRPASPPAKATPTGAAPAAPAEGVRIADAGSDPIGEVTRLDLRSPRKFRLRFDALVDGHAVVLPGGGGWVEVREADDAGVYAARIDCTLMDAETASRRFNVRPPAVAVTTGPAPAPVPPPASGANGAPPAPAPSVAPAAPAAGPAPGGGGYREVFVAVVRTPGAVSSHFAWLSWEGRAPWPRYWWTPDPHAREEALADGARVLLFWGLALRPGADPAGGARIRDPQLGRDIRDDDGRLTITRLVLSDGREVSDRAQLHVAEVALEVKEG